MAPLGREAVDRRLPGTRHGVSSLRAMVFPVREVRDEVLADLPRAVDPLVSVEEAPGLAKGTSRVFSLPDFLHQRETSLIRWFAG